MKVRIFRILAVVFSIVLFSAGIISALSVFMSLTGHNQAANKLLFIGASIFSTYHFSAFLIPLLFLYAAVLLLIPGWTRQSAFILAGFPLYFLTAVFGERLIYWLLTLTRVPLIKQFVAVSVLICILLLICFEVFLMIVLAGKRALALSAKYAGDVVSETYTDENEHEKIRTQDENAAVVPSVEESDAAITENAPVVDEVKAASVPAEEVEASVDTVDIADTTLAAADSHEAVEKIAQKTIDESVSVDDMVPEIVEEAIDEKAAVLDERALDESAENHPFTIEDAIRAEAESDSDEYHLDLSELKHEDSVQHDERSSFEEKPLAVESEETADAAEKLVELDETTALDEAVPTFTASRLNKPLPSFDPSDPNNLFDSLEEITADVKRINESYEQTESAADAAAEDVAAEQPCAAPRENNIGILTDHGTTFEASVEPVPETAEKEAALPSQPEEPVLPESEKLEEPVEVGTDKPLEYMPVPNQVSDLIDSLVVIDEEEAAGIESDDSESTDEVVYEEETAVIPSSDIVTAPIAAAAVVGNERDDFLNDDADRENDEDDTTIDELFEDEVVPVEEPVAPAPKPARKKYAIPFELLTNYPDGQYWIVDEATRRAAMMLKSTFNEFKIEVSITGIRKGPVVTMFEMLPSPGIKLSKITNLQDNIALRLAASNVRIVAPIPGKHAVGIEVPNKKRAIVSFRELIEADFPESEKMAIPVVLGKDVTGNPQILDLAQTPHLLIAGATGSGKSVCVNSIILSILYNRRPDEVKLILVDPKIVELKLYNDIGHLLSPVITEPKRAFQALQYCLCEMERRYALLDNMGVRDIKTFNARIKADKIAMEKLPYIVIIIDEFADLMATSGKELEATVSRLCAMSRAVGIHLVLATQRPSIDVITGLIKANIPSRIAFMVASKTDSRIILDEGGAEKLLGKGDMLFISAATPFPTRMQGAFVSEQEVERVVDCVKDYCEPEYIDDEIFVDDEDDSYDSVLYSENNDPLYDQALEIVTFAGKASASYVQRKLKIGYNRAARLIEEMEARGIVGPPNGSKPREVLRH